MSKNIGHDLVSSIVYGPVVSRRFGTTLGVNLLPQGKKFCSFNCVYCQLDWTDASYHPLPDEFPRPDEIATALLAAESAAAWREKWDELAYIVISGNGEPTLHPEFSACVDAILKFRNLHLPQALVICFTNGSVMNDENVLQALERLDQCHLKFDAALPHIDLPQDQFKFSDLHAASKVLHNLVVQSCFVTGCLDNTSNEDIQAWRDSIVKLAPKRVDVYTVSRPPAAEELLPVAQDRLQEIAGVLRKEGLCVVVVS